MRGGGPRVVVSTAAFHARVRGSVPGLGGLKETKLFLPHPRVKVSIVGSLRDREVACSASDRQGSNFESCVWRTVSSQSSHHPQEVLLAQFSLYVHKGGLKPDSFHFKTCEQHLVQIKTWGCWEGRGTMDRAWSFANVAVLNRAWCRIFPSNIMSLPSQSWDNISIMCPWARHFTLKCFTGHRWKWVSGRTEMEKCTDAPKWLYALCGVEMAHEWSSNQG